MDAYVRVRACMRTSGIIHGTHITTLLTVIHISFFSFIDSQKKKLIDCKIDAKSIDRCVRMYEYVYDLRMAAAL